MKKDMEDEDTTYRDEEFRITVYLELWGNWIQNQARPDTRTRDLDEYNVLSIYSDLYPKAIENSKQTRTWEFFKDPLDMNRKLR